jgi:hypothetical protein
LSKTALTLFSVERQGFLFSEEAILAINKLACHFEVRRELKIAGFGRR